MPCTAAMVHAARIQRVCVYSAYIEGRASPCGGRGNARAPELYSSPEPSGGASMGIRLDHIIVPAHDRVAAARLLAGLLDVAWEEERGNFTPVYVNDTLTLDFADREQFETHHLCFHVGDAEFEAILSRIQAAGIKYRSRPHGEDDMRINTRLGGKNLYWRDADGHAWEILTVSYARADSPPLTAATT